MFPSLSPSTFVDFAQGSQQEDTATATVTWTVVVIVALLVMGCLVFALIRYRHGEKEKALEVAQWADNRRGHGVANPLYSIPTDDGSSVTVIQDPYRVAGASNDVGLYDVVAPVDDTYGEVEPIDDAGEGYLDVGGAAGNYNHLLGPTTLSSQETTIYDMAQRQNSSGFIRGGGTSFRIPVDDGSSVVAYRESGADSEYLVVAGAGDLAPAYVDPTHPGASYDSVVPAEIPSSAAVLLASLGVGPGAVGAPLAAGPIPSMSFRKPNPATSTMSACAHMSAHKTCAFKAAGPSRYCSNHTCTLVGCLNNKPSGQTVCDQHSVGSIDLYGHQMAPPPGAEVEDPPPPLPAKMSTLDGEYLLVPGKDEAQYSDVAPNYDDGPSAAMAAYDVSPYDDTVNTVSSPQYAHAALVGGEGLDGVLYDTAGPAEPALNGAVYDVASADAANPFVVAGVAAIGETIDPSGYGIDVAL